MISHHSPIVIVSVVVVTSITIGVHVVVMRPVSIVDLDEFMMMRASQLELTNPGMISRKGRSPKATLPGFRKATLTQNQLSQRILADLQCDVGYVPALIIVMAIARIVVAPGGLTSATPGTVSPP